MTNLKKTLLYLGLPVLATVISIPFWPERYGDSYSEQQRKLWNEQMVLCPKDQNNILSGFPHILSSTYDPKLQKIIKQKTKLSEQFQNSHAPDWNSTPPVSPDLTRLPLEGMTSGELLHYATTNKNPDAWLLLLEYLPPEEQEEFHYLQLLFMKKWVSKANELQRPGTDFLLRVLDKMEKNTTPRYKSCGKINDIAGYDQFKQLIDSGDFPLYKALATILPATHKTALGNELESTLERKAREGDTTAQRQLGEYGFFNIEYGQYISHSIDDELNRPRSRFILWLTEQAEKWHIDWLPIRKTVNTSPTRDKLDEYAAWLKKAAEAGDLVAMQLWLTYGFETLGYCDKKNWDDILIYSDILLKAGFERWAQGFSPFVRYNQIIKRYYSPESLTRIDSEWEKTSFIRGTEATTYNRIDQNNWSKNSREYNLDLLEQVRRQNPGILIKSSNYFHYMKKIKDDVVKQRFADIIRETAHGGEPLFMAALADMIRQGILCPQDPDEATRLLETAWSFCRKYNPGFFYYPPDKPGSFYFLDEFIMTNLMSIYLLERPTPENQQKAFELAQQYFVSHNRLTRDYDSSFYLSLMYQKGYGTPIDPDQEQYYYELFLEKMKSDSENKEKKIKPLIEKFNYQMPE